MNSTLRIALTIRFDRPFINPPYRVDIDIDQSEFCEYQFNKAIAETLSGINKVVDHLWHNTLGEQLIDLCNEETDPMVFYHKVLTLVDRNLKSNNDKKYIMKDLLPGDLMQLARLSISLAKDPTNEAAYSAWYNLCKKIGEHKWEK